MVTNLLSRTCPRSMREIFSSEQSSASAASARVRSRALRVARRSLVSSGGCRLVIRWNTSPAMARFRQRRMSFLVLSSAVRRVT